MLTWFCRLTPHIRHAKQYQYNKCSLWYNHFGCCFFFLFAGFTLITFIYLLQLIFFLFVFLNTLFSLQNQLIWLFSFRKCNLFNVFLCTKSLRIFDWYQCVNHVWLWSPSRSLLSVYYLWIRGKAQCNEMVEEVTLFFFFWKMRCQ